ncbi:UNVERIFIED_CONTAM: hypothetical protein GTU68_039803 [Idotea baltica]|nr:hypothetical protein [Idotea baltica]
MISGHATIATAIEATKIGAIDFIEKPLDLDLIFKSVNKALGNDLDSSEIQQNKSKNGKNSSSAITDFKVDASKINPIAFESSQLQGKKIVQKTLANSAIIYGHGVHTGQKSGLLLKPLPAGSGIHFVSVTGQELIPAHLAFVRSTGYATTIKNGDHKVSTIEHLMSALCAYGITNLLVKCNGEVPVMDGSSLEFCNLIEEVGVIEQEGDWFGIKVDKTYQVGEGNEFIKIEPADELTIDYTLSYPDPIGVQKMTFTLDDPKIYKKEISSCRTFGFVKDIGALQKQGLAQGGRFDNFVLIGEEGIINSDLRFDNEAVRHKILDAIGDLYLLGRPLIGKITASMTGHSDNIELLKQIYSDIKNK